MLKAEEVFLNEFIESCFFRLMVLIADRGRERTRIACSHTEMACKIDSKRKLPKTDAGSYFVDDLFHTSLALRRCGIERDNKLVVSRSSLRLGLEI